MIIFKSLPLSFGIFWRLLVVLPVFLVIALPVMVAFSLVPIVGNLASSVAYAFAMLLGIRAGFQAVGVYSAPVFGRLLMSSVKWGAFEFVVYLLIFAFLFLGLSVVSLYDLDDYGALFRQTDPAVWWSFFAISPPVTALGLITLALIVGLSTAFSVPKAAAAHSAGNKVYPLNFFWGFGAGFIPILLVGVAGTALLYWSGAFARLVELVIFGIAYGFSFVTDEAKPELPRDQIVLIIGAVLLNFWTWCWWYAVVTLAFLKRKDKADTRSASAKKVPAEHQVDIRELRKSRR